MVLGVGAEAWVCGVCGVSDYFGGVGFGLGGAAFAVKRGPLVPKKLGGGSFEFLTLCVTIKRIQTDALANVERRVSSGLKPIALKVGPKGPISKKFRTSDGRHGIELDIVRTGGAACCAPTPELDAVSI